MPPMRLAFVVRSLFFQKPAFSTIHLAQEASRAGHEVWFVNLNSLTWTNDNTAIADGVRPGPTGDGLAYLAPLRQESPRKETVPLNTLDALFLRFNPFHPEFGEDLTTHPLFAIAEDLQRRGVQVVNAPRGLRSAASKGYVLGFSPSLRPASLVSRNPARLREFVEALGRPAILKPLGGSGGRNVFYVDHARDINLNQMLSAVRADSYVLAQEYIPGGEDKRVLLWEGEVIRAEDCPAVFRRVSPEGEIRSNMQLGATREPTTLTSAERAVVQQVGARLRSDGIRLAGLDLLGEKLLEVNVFCPGGIENCNQLYDRNFGAEIIRRLGRSSPRPSPHKELRA